ncbi:hypothetical protein [Kitasatospora sp. NPDC057223]|uniref:hypothetical protein n=1 Tax=Kitasatospora sp. NPDC057223 TaxID=3346055 RepID=UPI003640C8CD
MTAGKRLAAAVHLTHPTIGERLVLLPGDQVPPELAELITHPDAFLPTPDEDGDENGPDETEADEDDDPPTKAVRARKASTDTE